MKRKLLTLAAVTVFAAAASAQALLGMGGSILFNTITSSSSAAAGWYNGSANLEIFTIPTAGHVSLANTINADEQNIGSELAGISLIEANFTRQDISIGGGSMSSEAASQTLQISDGTIMDVDQGDYYVGTSATLSQTTPIYFALVFTPTVPYFGPGAVVLNNPAAGNIPSTSPPNSSSNEYPADDQNIIFAPFPEPATLTLAGLGGLSMLLLRRRQDRQAVGLNHSGRVQHARVTPTVTSPTN